MIQAQTEDHSERVIDKSDFPRGEWDKEPDKVNWVDATTNLDCMIIRTQMGNLCGYVAVNENHPLFGKDYGEVDASVHGGLTYANQCSGHICHIPEAGRPDTVWWFGFDCAHGGDLVPSMQGMSLGGIFPRPSFLGREEVYRNIAYVKAECEELAKQLKEYDPSPN